MTAANLAKHRNNPNMPFWTMLKEGNDHFEVTHLEPKVDVCDRHYVFDAQPPDGSTKPLVFNPTGRCPAYQVPQDIAGPALEKQRNDEYQLAQLIKENAPTEPVVWGTDGGMNRVFAAKLAETQPLYDNEGRLHAPPIHPGMPAPTLSGPRENPQDGFAQTQVASSSSGLFGGLFNSQATTKSGSAPAAPAVHQRPTTAPPPPTEFAKPLELLRQPVRTEEAAAAASRRCPRRRPRRLNPNPHSATSRRDAKRREPNRRALSRRWRKRRSRRPNRRTPQHGRQRATPTVGQQHAA